MTSTTDSTYQAPALTKGIAVLEFLSGQEEPHAASEIARALGRSRNEIYRMVIVLEQLGYITRTENDRFQLTRKLFDIAMRAPPQRNLLAKALPIMEDLSRECFQSCHLVVASGKDMVVVARIESPDMLGFSVRIGYRRPLNQSAAGRVMFACGNEVTRAAYHSAATGEDRDNWQAVEREAQTILDAGYYLSPSPYVDAVTDIAVPITAGQDGLGIAALVMPFIGGRSARISLSQGSLATRKAGHAISAELA